MKMKKIRPCVCGSARSKFYYLDPPLHSLESNYILIELLNATKVKIYNEIFYKIT